MLPVISCLDIALLNHLIVSIKLYVNLVRTAADYTAIVHPYLLYRDIDIFWFVFVSDVIAIYRSRISIYSFLCNCVGDLLPSLVLR